LIRASTCAAADPDAAPGGVAVGDGGGGGLGFGVADGAGRGGGECGFGVRACPAACRFPGRAADLGLAAGRALAAAGDRSGHRGDAAAPDAAAPDAAAPDAAAPGVAQDPAVRAVVSAASLACALRAQPPWTAT